MVPLIAGRDLAAELQHDEAGHLIRGILLASQARDVELWRMA
jgi:hypothetical protein